MAPKGGASTRMMHGGARHFGVGLFALAPVLFAPTKAEGQLKRAAAVQPVAEVTSGDVLIGMGVRHETGATFFLSGLSGDVTSLAVVHLALGIGSRALFEVKGASWQILSIDTATGETPVALDPGVEDGRTADAGDFELALSFLPIGATRGFSAGGP